MKEGISTQSVVEWLQENPNDVFVCYQCMICQDRIDEPSYKTYVKSFVAENNDSLYVAAIRDIEEFGGKYTHAYINAYPKFAENLFYIKRSLYLYGNRIKESQETERTDTYKQDKEKFLRDLSCCITNKTD